MMFPTAVTVTSNSDTYTAPWHRSILQAVENHLDRPCLDYTIHNDHMYVYIFYNSASMA